jgi:HEAT repeat protein
MLGIDRLLNQMALELLRQMHMTAPGAILNALPRLRTGASFRRWLALGLQPRNRDQEIHMLVAKEDWPSLKKAAPALTEEVWQLYLHHHDPGVRARMLELLIPEHPRLASEACRDALLSGRGDVLVVAAKNAPALVGAECCALLVSVLGNENRQARFAAAESLCHYGDAVTDVLRRALASDDWKQREAAVHVLPKWGGDRVIELLEQARSDPSPLVREEAHKVWSSGDTHLN